MSKGGEFDMEEMLKEVAGFDVNSENDDLETSEKEEEKNVGAGEEKKNDTTPIRKPTRKIAKAKKKQKISPTRNRSDFSPTMIRKNLLKFIGVLHPDRTLQDSVAHMGAIGICPPRKE